MTTEWGPASGEEARGEGGRGPGRGPPREARESERGCPSASSGHPERESKGGAPRALNKETHTDGQEAPPPSSGRTAPRAVRGAAAEAIERPFADAPDLRRRVPAA